MKSGHFFHATIEIPGKDVSSTRVHVSHAAPIMLIALVSVFLLVIQKVFDK